MKRTTTWIVATACAVALAGLVAFVASRRRGSDPAAPEAHGRRARVVLITEFSAGTHAAQYIAGAKREAHDLGLSLEVMDARNDRERMAELLDNAILQKVDGILISHGDPGQLLRGTERAVAKGIPVVAFDCEIPLEAVHKIDQNDHKIAEMGLQRLLRDTQGRANLVHIWVPGYAPMEKRMETFTRLMASNPGVREIERFGKATNNTALQTEVAMSEVLQKHPRGSIDVVWATWDEFARGAASAIRKAGRSEIKLYGIDISDEDLEMIQDPTSPWVATVGCPPAAVGRTQVRMLMYRIAGKSVPERYSLDPVLIAREMLPQGRKVSMDTLPDILPGLGDTKDFNEPWITALKEATRD